MTRYTIREVQTKKDLRRFIKFPFELYKGCDQYVPPLIKGQEHELMHAASLKYCTRKMWLAEDEKGKVVGRICAMINPRYNEKYGTRRARFGWFDLINDMEVARMLFDAAESWAKSEGMEEIHGPLYYNTLGRQGMLVEGYDKLAPFSCIYNYPYYVDIVQQLGFEKECDWLQYRMPADQGVIRLQNGRISHQAQKHTLASASLVALEGDDLFVMTAYLLPVGDFPGVDSLYLIQGEAFYGIIATCLPRASMLSAPSVPRCSCGASRLMWPMPTIR